MSLKTGFLFAYNLVQFLGFSWIFVNMTVRLFIFGKGEIFELGSSLKVFDLLYKNPVRPIIYNTAVVSDSLYDTFHTISDMMFFCQILATVEVLNAAFGVVKTATIPTLIQVQGIPLPEFQLHGATNVMPTHLYWVLIYHQSIFVFY